jgi:hypothetical protein
VTSSWNHINYQSSALLPILNVIAVAAGMEIGISVRRSIDYQKNVPPFVLSVNRGTVPVCYVCHRDRTGRMLKQAYQLADKWH